jgi:hypothetical protein
VDPGAVQPTIDQRAVENLRRRGRGHRPTMRPARPSRKGGLRANLI